MHRLLAALAALVALSAAAMPGLAGSAEEPELTDPDGDQEVQRGPLVVPTEEDAFSDIDIVAAWVVDRSGPDAGPGIIVQTAEPPQPGAVFSITFRLDRGPTSYWNSIADGRETTVNITIEETPAEPIVGVGTDLYFQGAGGGDVLTIVSVTSSRTDTGNEPLPVTQDDQSGSDEAGPGVPYTLPRDPVVAGVALAVLGEPTWDGDTGALVLPGGEAVNLTLRITNEGTDLDRFTATADRGNLSASTWELVPGASQEFTWSLPQADDGSESRLTVTSERGANRSVSVHQPAVLAERAPVPANLSPLTPAAVALGFDGIFGELAELALLAVAVLLVILILFLITTLQGRRPSALEPPAAVGDVALHAATRDLREEGRTRPERRGTGHVEVEEHREETVRHVATDRPRTGSASGTGSADPGRYAASGRAALGDRLDSIRKSVDTLAPGQRTRRVVVRLDDVRHHPQDPQPGDRVRTTARIQNGGTDAARLRVVLQVDGRDVEETTLTLGPGATRPVELTWVSRHGGGDVRLQVFEAA